MTAVQLGPLVLSSPRFAALVGLLVFVVAAHLTSRSNPRLVDWAWNSALIVVLGARLGFVLENLGAYLQEPLTILYFWQGGFSPVWGFVLAAVNTLVRARKGWLAFWTSSGRLTIAVSLLGLAAWGGTQLLLTPADQTEVRRPQSTLLTLAGEPTDLAAVAAGRPTVLNLWAPWCLSCRRETPMVIDVAAWHDGTAVVLADQGTGAAAVAKFLDARDLPYDAVFLDEASLLGHELRSVGLPTTFFFAADGSLEHTHVGEISRAELERRIRALHD